LTTAAKSAAKPRYRDALRSHDLRKLAAAYTVDALGGWAQTVVLIVYVYDRTGSTTWVAALGASRWVPGLLLASVGGVIADRYDRARVMVWSAMASFVVTCVVAGFVASDGPIWVFVITQAVSAATFAPYRPAAGALTPEVVSEKDIIAANSLFALLESITVVVGPAVGGLLLLTGKPVTGILLNAASFLGAAAIAQRLSVRSRGGAEPGGNMVAQWVDGLRSLAAHHTAFMLVLFCALDSAIYGAATVIYAPLSEHLGTGANGYSYLLAGAALGGVIAAGLANRASASGRLAPIIVGSLVLEAVPFLFTVWAHWPAVAFVLQVASGVGMIIVDVLALTALQRDLPGDVLSRVLGVFDTLVLGAIVAASFAASILYSASGDSLNTVLIAIGVFFPAMALLCLPMLIRADRKMAGEIARLAPRVELLARLDLFSGAPRPVLERLAAAAEEQHLPARKLLIREGDPADALWILVDGALNVRIQGDSDTARQLPAVEAPGYVGELGLLHHRPRTASVRTRGASTVLRIDGQDFLSAVEESKPSVALLSTASNRLARSIPRQRRPVATERAPRSRSRAKTGV
jgi:MFS family permease